MQYLVSDFNSSFFIILFCLHSQPMGNQQQSGRTRSDTYTRYERDGEDGRYVTLDHNDSGGNNHLSSFDERVNSD